MQSLSRIGRKKRTKDGLRLVGNAREFGTLGASNRDKALRKTNELIKVAHDDWRIISLA